MKRKFLLIAGLAGGAMLAGAATWQLPGGEPKLKPGQGADLVAAQCQICHSADYISTQPYLNRATWTAIVQKMRDRYGAPLPAEKVDDVVNYLVANYGKK